MNNNYASKCPHCGAIIKNINKGLPTLWGNNELEIKWLCVECNHTGTAIYKISFEGHFWVANEAQDITSIKNYTIQDLKQSKGSL